MADNVPESDNNNQADSIENSQPETNPNVQQQSRVQALINSDPLDVNSLNNPNPITDPSRIRPNLLELYRGTNHQNTNYRSRGIKRSITKYLPSSKNYRIPPSRQRHSSTNNRAPSPTTDDKLLTCPICKCIFKDPYMLTTCGHTFCFFCIKKAQARDPRCPVCLIEVKNVNDPSTLVQNITIDNLISQHKKQRNQKNSSYLSDITEPSTKTRKTIKHCNLESEFRPFSPIPTNTECLETSNFIKQSLSLDDMALLIENDEISEKDSNKTV